MTSGRNAPRPVLLLAVLLLVIGSTSALWGQEPTGEIRGKVTSSQSSEGLLRASVSVVGTKPRLGAFSDLNGVFLIRNVPPGRYTLEVKYASYNVSEITDVVVTGGKVATVNVILQPQRGVVVTVREHLSRGTSAGVLKDQLKSGNVSDGISAAEISRLPAATGADALSRITGVSTIGSKFAQIRGAGERYNNTQLNGISLVSTEPGKRAFSYDLVPSNLLQNSVVLKTFTPDLPGDFSGGLVQMQTVDFPDERTIRLSLSTSYVGGTTFKDLELGPRGSTDYLGIDDGARELPTAFGDTARFTSLNYTAQQRADLARLLPNSFRVKPITSAPNLGLVASYGDRFELDEGYNLGVVAALSYRNSYDRSEISRSNPFNYDYSGTENQFTTLWGGLLNVTAKLGGLHTISVKNLYNRSAEDKFTTVSGTLFSAPLENHPYTFQYLQRSFYSGQLVGDHLFPLDSLSGIRFGWRAFASYGERQEPDLRRISNGRPDGDSAARLQAPLSSFLPSAYGAGRIFSNLNEELFGGGGDITVPIDIFKVKFGALVENKSRDFNSRAFAYVLSDSSRSLVFSAIDTLFEPSHIRSDAISIVEVTQTADSYHGESHLRAGYTMVDLPFQVMDQRFRSIFGARYEDSRVAITTVDGVGDPLTVDYATFDWLPSLNLTWEASPLINVRLAYSRTVARPDFREYARYVFYDFILNSLTYGNPTLRRTLISNYDFRFEFFPDAGELFAASVFRKEFTDAIEEIGLNGNSPERTWVNANATNTGVELEVRKGLSFISESLQEFSFSTNYTWLDSKVETIASDSQAVATKSVTRTLQGQSPYIVNVAFYYDNYTTGTSATIAYNTFGRRLVRIGRSDEPNLVEESRDRIDLSVAQTLFGSLELKLSIKDLLEQDVVLTQYEGKKPAELDLGQRTITLGVAARF